MDEINHKNLDTKRLIRNTNKFKLFYGISFSSEGRYRTKKKQAGGMNGLNWEWNEGQPERRVWEPEAERER